MNEQRRHTQCSAVKTWLGEIGLEQYLPAFLENHIDVETIPQLTAEDLREIGVSSVGHRRRIIDAIEQMKAGASGSSPNEAPAAKEPAAGVCGGISERRQVTTIFCDLVGFTPLAVSLDPEAMHDLLGAYKDACVAVIGAAGGHVLKFLGDGILATFGYPRAGEEDAVRAVTASLELVRVVGELTAPSGERLAVRVGVATGVVVVGDQVGEVAVERGALIGETPNLAARLQAAGQPGHVIVAGSTRALLANAFETERLPDSTLKDSSGNVEVHRVVGHRTAPIRFESRNPAGLTALEGREGEIARLLSRRELAVAKHGQIVAVYGDAGIGKSRLVMELFRELDVAAENRTILQCSPFHTGTPFFPIRSYLERSAEMVFSDSPQVRMAKLETVLERFGPPNAERSALFADLVGIGIEGTQLARDFRSNEIRERLIRTMLDLLERITAREAVIVIEDVQWCDPSTNELFMHFASMVPHSPVLLIATSRAASPPRWLDLPDVTVLTLERLLAEETRSIVKNVANPQILDRAVLDGIVARSDGVPLFAEELTRAFLARGSGAGIDVLAIPSTLTESLLAQLDLLENARDTVELAAVIGREFPEELLIAVSSLDATNSRDVIDRLVGAGILVRRRGIFGPSLAFRQTLVRDTAYGLLLRRERMQLHRLIADTIETRFAQIAEAVPHVLAFHRTESGDRGAAIAYWRRAASDAVRRSAAPEAVAHLEKALESALASAAGPDRDDLELELLLERAGPLIAAEGYGSDRVVAEMDRALKLARMLGSPDRMVPALMHQWLKVAVQNDIEALYPLANQIREFASGGSEVARLIAARVLASTNLFSGKLAASIAEIDTFDALYDPTRHAAALAKIGATTHAVTMRLVRAEIAWLRGEADTAAQIINTAIRIAEEDGHVNTLCQTVAFAAVFASVIGDVRELAIQAVELKRLTARYELPFWRPYADLLTGVAELGLENRESGAALARRGIGVIAAKRHFLLSCWCVVYAGACANTGFVEDGLLALESANSAIAKGERWFAAEVYRLRARLRALAGCAPASIRRDLEEAITLARAHGTRLFEERAIADLAALDAATRR